MSMRQKPTLMVILIVLPVMAIFLAPTLLSGGLFQWSVSAFKLYAKPHFDKGRGWTYLPVERNIEREGDFAWFDEQLDNERLGRCRGTGVLIKENGEWKVLHYSLTFLIPNSIAAEVGALTMKASP